MRAAEIDGGDAGGIGGQVGQDVAAARGDRHDMAVGLQRQRFEVDLRVLPDLGVDQPAEEALEQPLEESFTAQRPVAAYRLLEAQIAIGPRIDQSKDSTLEPILPTYWVSVPVS